jgi:DnaJ-class molecular chaperone
MSLDEARRILGVEAAASRKDVQEAYTRLMRAVHPDKGGTAGLAAQLNAARDRLLKR